MEKWSKTTLVNMILDETYTSPIIRNNNDVTAQRVFIDDRPCIRKVYPHGLNARSITENSFLFWIKQYPEIAPHVAKLALLKDRTNTGLEIYTRWVGLDLNCWHSVLGSATPFLNTVPGLLALIRGIFKATEGFHSADFVHNDLHRGNIVLGYSLDPKTRSGNLQISTPKLIDFEFTLFPRSPSNGLPGRQPSLWVDDKGEVVCLDPESHSLHIIPCEMHELNGEFYPRYHDPKNLSNHERRNNINRLLLKPNAAQNLLSVDFGIDFFTISRVIEKLTQTGEKYWDKNHKEIYFDAYNLLYSMPNYLRNFNNLSEIKRICPHQFLINQIDRCLFGISIDTSFSINTQNQLSSANPTSHHRNMTTVPKSDPSTATDFRLKISEDTSSSPISKQYLHQTPIIPEPHNPSNSKKQESVSANFVHQNFSSTLFGNLIHTTINYFSILRYFFVIQTPSDREKTVYRIDYISNFSILKSFSWIITSLSILILTFHHTSQNSDNLLHTYNIPLSAISLIFLSFSIINFTFKLISKIRKTPLTFKNLHRLKIPLDFLTIILYVFILLIDNFFNAKEIRGIGLGIILPVTYFIARHAFFLQFFHNDRFAPGIFIKNTLITWRSNNLVMFFDLVGLLIFYIITMIFAHAAISF